MRCLNCKYDLRKLTEHRCPECGREFDPNDPGSVLLCDSSPQTTAPRRALITFASVFGGAFVIIWFTYGFSFMKYPDALLGAVVIAVWVSPLIVAQYLINRMWR